MARPRKEGMDYFPHDTDATNDRKIEALRLLYGNDGYAFYFILLEMIYREPNFELDISDAETIQILAKKVSVTEEEFSQMLSTAIKRECFDPEAYYERNILTSNGIKKRANVVVEKREKMRETYKNRASSVSYAETPQETTPESTQSKVKESKRKVKDKVKEKDNKPTKIAYAEFVKLSEEEYQKLVTEHGEDFTKECITTLDNYKGAKGEKYASDYRAILKWVIDAVRDKKAKALRAAEQPQRHATPNRGYNRPTYSGKPAIHVVPKSPSVQEPSEEEFQAMIAKAQKLDTMFN
ncbi:DUF4373 domain-containing protein [Paenibacillus lutrae]|uniref:DUF4373 domain-containing protein n=1 Tax=Paenibacillus lutrae TaxID=2078573 RepID=A0A7X3JZX5_9BACL|nr:DUF4373 domain-containing protein [Paenibacillus lutrae]MVP00381.1 DUF4373 domain-containing protein [Paenibacillus lutrae]